MVKQNYRCAGCGMKVAPEYANRFRYCEYLGRYFCTGCHTNQLALIPGKVLTKWDFTRWVHAVVLCTICALIVLCLNLSQCFSDCMIEPTSLCCAVNHFSVLGMCGDDLRQGQDENLENYRESR